MFMDQENPTQNLPNQLKKNLKLQIIIFNLSYKNGNTIKHKELIFNFTTKIWGKQ